MKRIIALLLLIALPASAALIATPNVSTTSSHQRNYDAAITVTPSDANTFSAPVTIFVGVGGTVACTPAAGGADVVFTATAGMTLPVRVVAVKATGTTATLMIAVY